MEVVPTGHMDVEDEIFYPYRGIGCPVVRFNIDGFESFGEFMIHYFISEAKRVCGASMLGHTAT